jgi:hypothetical protein
VRSAAVIDTNRSAIFGNDLRTGAAGGGITVTLGVIAFSHGDPEDREVTHLPSEDVRHIHRWTQRAAENVLERVTSFHVDAGCFQLAAVGFTATAEVVH